MIKHPVSNGDSVAVTFELPASVNATTAAVCGEFNQWSPTAHPLARASDGRLQATVDLQTGRAWRFRYVLDGERWENDWAPDAYVPNDFGGDDSVVDLTEIPRAAKARATAKRAGKASSAAKAPAASKTARLPRSRTKQ